MCATYFIKSELLSPPVFFGGRPSVSPPLTRFGSTPPIRDFCVLFRTLFLVDVRKIEQFWISLALRVRLREPDRMVY